MVYIVLTWYCVMLQAVIASNGHLTPNYEYIADLRRKKS